MTAGNRLGRNGNVEVLRCFLMLLIVFHHVGWHGCFGPPTDWWTLLVWGLVMWHVDGFVAISGWFGIHLTFKKLISLYGVMMFYSALGCLLWWIFDRSTFGLGAFVVSGGWFGGAYLMLMLMSPMVNASLEYLRQDKRVLFVAWLLFAVGMTLSWIPLHLNTAVASGVGGWSLLCLLFVYVSARTMRAIFENPVPKKCIILGLSVLPFGICMCGGGRIMIRLIRGKEITYSLLNYLTVYDAPHVWIFAILVVMLVVWHMNFSRKIQRICSFIGPSMFGVYLMHEVMHNGKMIYRVPQEWLCSFGVPPFACVVLTAITTFLFCLIVDICRRLLIAPLKGKILAVVDVIELKGRIWIGQQIDLLSKRMR